ncbi:MAG: pyruvate, phosphate dikinase [Anaerolineales bacterium]|uniref:Pyruvate, phosphate dikinase n=1 Tax=Candidatus Desulfolinea nitratireducens TaxID=2841698 RepID=A0A8J6TFG1_9CHLR|nr:pyruvate, phosphate dikinase [Candidatus Desulfolinea nitratireducens]
MHKWIYLFDEVAEAEKHAGDWDAVRSLLGGKGANLGDMTRIGVPVPPGFTATTEACLAYLESGNQFPKGLWEQELDAIKATESATGKKFGDPKNPLLVSSRSGAKFSMPGMMDTVLNIGMNDEVADGMVKMTGDARFVYDAYRRLVQMFGSVVLRIDDEAFEHPLKAYKEEKGYKSDTEMTAHDWQALTELFKAVTNKHKGYDFPQDPYEQLKLATEAVFSSWNGKRAVDYRNAANISHDLGTAVNIQTMVFGNMENSGTGVAFTRNPSTGERKNWGEYLMNAQGEDVVAGIRNAKEVGMMKAELPEAYADYIAVCDKLEAHYREMQDVEFTIEHGKLWMLQTRNGKRTAKAAVTIAVDMANEGLISKEEAVTRVQPEQVDTLLHPQFVEAAKRAADDAGKMFGTGVNASPGAAVGRVYFDADTAEAKAKEEGQDVIMVRPFTKPDDVHGMLAAKGILTSEGGATSHAAVVARQFGIPCVVGASAVRINMEKRQFVSGGVTVVEGDWISVDGTTGEVFLGKIDSVAPILEEQTDLLTLLNWADEISATEGIRTAPEGWPTRGLQVWANADYPEDARRARSYGAQGIGLCRTEHMFFEPERLPIVQKMILAGDDVETRQAALDKLLPFQRSDFDGLFEAMTGLPVIIRLLDPPLHEFMPDERELLESVIEARVKGEDAIEKERLLAEIEALHESNPMMGLRGVRLSVMLPEIVSMQVRAIFEAAADVKLRGFDPHPEVMIPLTGHVNELHFIQPKLEKIAAEVMAEKGVEFSYKFGTMIEIPRAGLTADQIAETAEFFSFGTNDLTQFTFGYSRDDAERNFLVKYVEDGILEENPFQTIDRTGVGQLMDITVKKGRATRIDLECGICGEHGGDPNSIDWCYQIGLNYVSCSPFRVPIARLAAAHSALEHRA